MSTFDSRILNPNVSSLPRDLLLFRLIHIGKVSLYLHSFTSEEEKMNLIVKCRYAVELQSNAFREVINEAVEERVKLRIE